jgi:hypothetical protein
MSEEKWFEAYNWNAEPDTIKLLFIMKQPSEGVSRSVEQFLESIDIKPEARHKPEIKNKMSYCGWVVDMSSRKYKRLSQWEITLEKRNGVKVGWPSQMQIHMIEKRGTIVGHQFGI